MAGDEHANLVTSDKNCENSETKLITCNYCKAKLLQGVKCPIIGYKFHPSCYDRAKEKLRRLWEGKSENNGEVQQLQYTIDLQKTLIEELKDKNKLLQENTQLLQEKFKVSLATKTKVQVSDPKTCLQTTSQNLKPKSYSAICEEVAGTSKSRSTKKDSTTTERNNNNSKYKQNAQKSCEVNQLMKDQEKLAHEIIYINNDEWQQPKTRKKPNKPEVNKKSEINKKHVIIGEAKVNTLKSAPKKAFIYVGRLDSLTKPENIEEILKEEFPEIVCEQITSKYPQYYSSFKITCDLVNFEKIMDARRWPYGSYLTRFFHPRKKTLDQNQ